MNKPHGGILFSRNKSYLAASLFVIEMLLIYKTIKGLATTDNILYKDDYFNVIPHEMFSSNRDKPWFVYARYTSIFCLRRVIALNRIMANTEKNLGNCIIQQILNTRKIKEPNGGIKTNNISSFTGPIGILRLLSPVSSAITWKISVNPTYFHINITFTAFSSVYNGSHCCDTGLYLVAGETSSHVTDFYGAFCGTMFPFTVYTKNEIMMLLPNISKFSSLRLQYQLIYRKAGLSFHVNHLPKLCQKENKKVGRKELARTLTSHIKLYYKDSFMGKIYSHSRIQEAVPFLFKDIPKSPDLLVKQENIRVFSYQLIVSKLKHLLFKRISGKLAFLNSLLKGI